MKPGMMRTSRSSSGRRPSVRAGVSLAGLKLILSLDLHGFEAARRTPQEALGDVREALRRVRHVEVIQIVAQRARARAGLAQVAQLLRRRAPQALPVYQVLDGAGRRLARVDQADAVADRLPDHAPQDRVVRAAQDERPQPQLPQLAQVLFGDRARHVGLRPPLLRQRDEERAPALDARTAARAPGSIIPTTWTPTLRLIAGRARAEAVLQATTSSLMPRRSRKRAFSM